MTMKPATILGMALILLGLVAFAYQGITYTTREKVIDLGPLQATVDTKKTLPLPPLVGGLALVSGIVLLIVGARKA
jgi:membrane-bound ClpP family serine protease